MHATKKKASSGSILTVRFFCGFPSAGGRASLGYARESQVSFECRGPCRFRGGRGEPEQPAKARLARQDRPADGCRPRDERDHATHRQGQDRHLALAGAVRLRRPRRSVARQDAPLAHPAARSGDCGARGLPDARWATGKDDSLDRPSHGRRDRDQRQFGSVPMVCSRIPFASSSSPTIRSSPPSGMTSSGSTSIRRTMPSCSRSTRRARFRRSTALSPACR